MLTGGPGGGAAVGLAFGLVRALPVLGLRRVTTPARLHALGRRTARLEPLARRPSPRTLVVLALATPAALLQPAGASLL